MYVCSCMGVTDRTIRTTIRNGASTVAEVGRQCGAGTRCGGCWPTLDELLDRYAGVRGQPQPAA